MALTHCRLHRTLESGGCTSLEYIVAYSFTPLNYIFFVQMHLMASLNWVRVPGMQSAPSLYL